MKLIAMFCMFLRRIDRLCVSVDVDVDVTSIAFVFYESEVLPHHGSVLFARALSCFQSCLSLPLSVF